MNQETFDYFKSYHPEKIFAVPFSMNLQLNNISYDDSNISYNGCIQQNPISLFYNIDNPKISQNFNISEKPYVTKPKKKPIYKPHCKWSKEEDEKLKELVKEYGENDWRHLAKKFEGRNSRQCRERWNYYLNPRLKQGKWTIEEDLKILEKYNQLGPRWMEISKYFESRTDAMIKNRYNYLIRKKRRHNIDIYDIHFDEDTDSEFINESNSFISIEKPEPSPQSPSSPLEDFTSLLFPKENSHKFDEINYTLDDTDLFNYNESLNNELDSIEDFFN